MRYIFRFVTILIVVCIFASCKIRGKSSDDKNCFSISIVFDSSSKSKVFYGELLLISGADTMEYDTTHFEKQSLSATYIWKNIPSGDYQYKINTIYHRPKVGFIKITKDTVIQIWNDTLFEFVNLIPKNYLSNADTIDFAFESYGCSFTIDKYMLVKKDNTYRLLRAKDYRHDMIDKVVEPEIVEDLYKMQLKCNSYNVGHVRGFRAYQFIMIAGQKAFYFDDRYSIGSDFFDQFIARYAGIKY